MSSPSIATADQLAALRSEAALCVHGTRSLVLATGGDLLAWLERIASLSVKALEAGGLRALTLMDGKGKLRADPRVLAPGTPAEGLLLELPASHHAAVFKLLSMYVISDDVQLEDRSETWSLVSLAGPRAGHALDAAGWRRPAAEGCVLTADGLLIAPCELSGVGGFDLLGPNAVVAAAQKTLTEQGLSTVPLDALQVARVTAGVPWFAEDLSGGVIPLEALLDRKVSSTKGCYPGQEVVARITNLGQVARRLVRFVADGAVDLNAGTELLADDGRAVGQLTSLVHDPQSGTSVGLGYARRSHWSDGASVRAGDVVLQVQSLSA